MRVWSAVFFFCSCGYGDVLLLLLLLIQRSVINTVAFSRGLVHEPRPKLRLVACSPHCARHINLDAEQRGHAQLVPRASRAFQDAIVSCPSSHM